MVVYEEAAKNRQRNLQSHDGTDPLKELRRKMETTLRHSDIAATCVQYTTNTLAIIFPAYCSFSLSSTTECTVRVAVVVLCCNLVGCCCCSWWYWVGRVSSFPYLSPIEVPALLRLIDKRRHRTIHATINHMQGNRTIGEY